MPKIKIKENVVFILKTKNLTQGDLAERLGITRQSLHYLLSGNISLDKLADLAEALGTLPSELVSDPPLAMKKAFVQIAEPTDTTLTCPCCGKTLKITARE